MSVPEGEEWTSPRSSGLYGDQVPSVCDVGLQGHVPSIDLDISIRLSRRIIQRDLSSSLHITFTQNCTCLMRILVSDLHVASYELVFFALHSKNPFPVRVFFNHVIRQGPSVLSLVVLCHPPIHHRLYNSPSVFLVDHERMVLAVAFAVFAELCPLAT